eukprot:SAG22_NODE_7525_length_731_cov_1.354430_1_plen_21_part_10
MRGEEQHGGRDADAAAARGRL